MTSKYKVFLKDLADHLTQSDVETIKFLFGTALPGKIYCFAFFLCCFHLIITLT